MRLRLTSAIAALVSVAVVMIALAPAVAAASGDRVLVSSSQLAKRPYRGIILVSAGDGVVCTGFIVSRRQVVTAAHCLARDAANGDYRFRRGVPGKIRLYRAYSLLSRGPSYTTCGVSKAWAHPSFIRRNARDGRFGSRAHDFAVLTTERGCTYPRNSVNRMWATTADGGELRAGQRVKIGGYPSDPRVDDMNGLNLWRTRGEVQPRGSDDRLMDVTGFVAQGMSGGPIWRTYRSDSPCGRKQCVVAILTECAVNPRGLCQRGDSARRAVRITPAVKQAIRRH